MDWDDPIPQHLRANWIELLSEMFDIQEIKLKHCIKSGTRNLDEKPNLVTFLDGSMKAFCACTYIQWKLLNGKYSSHLISAKARIEPTNKISIPRMELQDAVMSCWLHNAVKNSLGMKFNEEVHIVDSGAVMDMIIKESTSCKEFVGTRIGEIRNKSDVGTWACVQSKDNPADLGTHGIKPDEMGEGSFWQEGPQWLKLNIQHWPIDYHYRENMPAEELIQIHKVNIVDVGETVINIQRFNSYLKIGKLRSFKIKEITSEDIRYA